MHLRKKVSAMFVFEEKKMISKEVEFTKDGLVIYFEDGKSLTINNEIAEQIWYFVEAKETEEIIKEYLPDDEFSKEDKDDIVEFYIGRAKSITKLLKEHILEEAIFDLNRISEEDNGEIGDDLLAEL